MNAVLLDTDVFSFLIKQGDTRSALYQPHVKGKTIALSFVSVGELYCWPIKKKWGPKRIADLEARIKAAVIVPYDLELCRVYARVKGSLPSGRNVAANDLWIAVCAIRHSIPLVTHNHADFKDIPGLTIISEAPQAATVEPGNLFDESHKDCD